MEDADPTIPEHSNSPGAIDTNQSGRGSDETAIVTTNATGDDDLREIGADERYFGDYELLSVLGRGGMGVVYKARQLSLNRPVAVKMLQSRVLATADDLKRFQNEAEAVAMLDHPNIVPILEVGECRDQRYYSMKLIDGSSLEKHLNEFRGDPKGAARLVATIARAVDHAHERGILHRDLKPANVLLDDRRQPFVTDFGLAKRVEVDSELTQSGAILGTPAYMAPEQASGRRKEVTRATDVYGLGAILYALLTGKAPFRADTVVEMLQAVRDQVPEYPSKENRLVPRDLEVICLKCLEKETSRRYERARDLATDLERFLAGESITARPVGRLERSWRWCRRNSLVVGFSAAIILLVTVLGGVIAVLGRRAALRRPIDATVPLTSKSQPALGEAASGRIAVGIPDDATVAHISYGGDVTTVVGRGVHDVLRPAGEYQLKIVTDGSTRNEVIKVTPEKSLEVGSKPESQTPAASREEVETWFYRPQLKLTTGGHDAPVREMLFSSDGSRLYSAGDDKVVHVWNLRDPLPVIERTLRPPVWRGPRGMLFAMALSGNPDAQGQSYLAVGGYGIESSGGDLTIFRVPGAGRKPSGEIVKRLERTRGVVNPLELAHRNTVTCLAFDRDGGVLASGSRDGAVILWDARAGFAPIRALASHNGAVRALSFSLDGRRLATSGADGRVLVWDVVRGEVADALETRVPINTVVFSPDGQFIVVGAENGVIVRLDCAKLSGKESGAVLRAADGKPILKIACHPGGALVAASVKSDTSPLPDPMSIACDIELRAMARGKIVKQWPSVPGLVRALAFSPKGDRLAYSGGPAQAIMIRDTSDLSKPALECKGDGTTVFDLAFTADSHVVGFTRERFRRDDPPRRYEGFDLVQHRFRAVERDQLRRCITAYQGWTLVTDHKSAAITAVHNDGRSHRFDVRSPIEGLPWSATIVPPGPAHPSPTVAIGTETGVVFFELDTGRRTRVFAGHTGPVVSLAASPDGRWLASSSYDQVIMLYSLANCDRRPALGARLRRQADQKWVVESVDPQSFADLIGLRAGDVIAEAAIGMERFTKPDELARFSARADEMAPGQGTIGIRVRRMIWLPILNAVEVTRNIPCSKRDNALLTLFQGVDREWVLWTRQGYYDSSAVADQKYLGWHRNGDARDPSSEFSPAISFQAQFRRPDLLTALWTADDPARYEASLERLIPGNQDEPHRLAVLAVGPSGSPGAATPAFGSRGAGARDVAGQFVALGRRFGFDQVDVRFLAGDSATAGRIHAAFAELQAERPARRPRPGDTVVVFLAARVNAGTRGLSLLGSDSSPAAIAESGALASDVGASLKGLAQRGYHVVAFLELSPVADDDRLVGLLTEWERELFLAGVAVLVGSADAARAPLDGSGQGALATALANVLKKAAPPEHEGNSRPPWTLERFNTALQDELRTLTGGREQGKGYFVDSAAGTPFLEPDAFEKQP